MKSGIYKIEHIESGKSYIGSAVDIKSRFRLHKSDLRLGKHRNGRLQNSWNKYGAEAFRFSAMIICSPEKLVMYEQLLMDGYNVVKTGFNISPIAGNQLGMRHTDATKAIMSAMKKGKKQTPSHIANAAKGRKGRKMPPMSVETRAKISAANRARKHPPRTPEWKAKIGAAHKGRKFSPERCKMMSEISKGRKHTEKSKINMTIAQKSRRAVDATNFQKRQKNNTSGYQGVGWRKRISKYVAAITVERRKIYIGSFNTAEEARQAYCQAATKYHGEFARYG